MASRYNFGFLPQRASTGAPFLICSSAIAGGANMIAKHDRLYKGVCTKKSMAARVPLRAATKLPENRPVNLENPPRQVEKVDPST